MIKEYCDKCEKEIKGYMKKKSNWYSLNIATYNGRLEKMNKKLMKRNQLGGDFCSLKCLRDYLNEIKGEKRLK